MAGYVVTGPDGKRYKVKVPEGATNQDAIDYVKKTYYSEQPPAAPDVTVTKIGEREIEQPAEPAPSYIESDLARVVPKPASDAPPEEPKTFTELALEPLTSYPEV